MPSGGYLRYGWKIGLKFQREQRREALLKRASIKTTKEGRGKKDESRFPSILS